MHREPKASKAQKLRSHNFGLLAFFINRSVRETDFPKPIPILEPLSPSVTIFVKTQHLKLEAATYKTTFNFFRSINSEFIKL